MWFHVIIGITRAVTCQFQIKANCVRLWCCLLLLSFGTLCGKQKSFGDWTCCHSCNSMQCWCETLSGVVVALRVRQHPGWDGTDWKQKVGCVGRIVTQWTLRGVIVPLVAKTHSHCWALWSHATPGHGHWFHHLNLRGDMDWDSNLGELCCPPALIGRNGQLF